MDLRIQQKMTRRRFQWFGQGRREAESRMLSWMEEMEVPGKRKAGRSTKT